MSLEYLIEILHIIEQRLIEQGEACAIKDREIATRDNLIADLRNEVQLSDKVIRQLRNTQ